jgi:hypothetical protein
MRALAALAVIAATTTAACSRTAWFRQYEYEEDVYLSLDGSATVNVNSSIPALDALRGASFDPGPAAAIDRAAVRTYFSSARARVGWVTTSRRSGRRFVHVRLDVDDIRRLSEAAPFAWSSYRFGQEGNLYVYRQTVGRSARKPVSNAGWTGAELVAFRLHLPSKIADHNMPGSVKRGNILVWEQRLDDRLRGVPLFMEARMQTQSILYRTLWLFVATGASVAVTFVLLIWWVMRRGAQEERQRA